MILSVISHGHTDWADVAFLVGFLIALLWIVGILAEFPGKVMAFFLPIILACICFAWLVL